MVCKDGLTESLPPPKTREKNGFKGDGPQPAVQSNPSINDISFESIREKYLGGTE